jgi:hypothetical protein
VLEQIDVPATKGQGKKTERFGGSAGEGGEGEWVKRRRRRQRRRRRRTRDCS